MASNVAEALEHLKGGKRRDRVSLQDDPLLTTVDLENESGISRRTWEGMRFRGVGPPFIRIGNRIRYRRSIWLKWLEAQTRTCTSEEVL